MGVMVKEELHEKVAEVRRVSDRVMTVVAVFEEDVLRLMCECASQGVWRKNSLFTMSCNVSGMCKLSRRFRYVFQ